jgi:DNA-binding MarR family transcriptional regulator
MHQISFMLKRCSHSALRFHRQVSLPFHPKLTPARFDLLHTMVRRESTEQTEIVKNLGVTRPTISRMLRSLRELGWVQRRRSPRHPRAWLIFLTDVGRSLMKRVSRVIFKRKLIHRVYRGFDDYSHPDPDWRIVLAVQWLEHLARHLGDRATLEYPYGHPD